MSKELIAALFRPVLICADAACHCACSRHCCSRLSAAAGSAFADETFSTFFVSSASWSYRPHVVPAAVAPSLPRRPPSGGMPFPERPCTTPGAQPSSQVVPFREIHRHTRRPIPSAGSPSAPRLPTWTGPVRRTILDSLRTKGLLWDVRIVWVLLGSMALLGAQPLHPTQANRYQPLPPERQVAHFVESFPLYDESAERLLHSPP